MWSGIYNLFPMALQEINSFKFLQEINLDIPSKSSWYWLFNALHSLLYMLCKSNYMIGYHNWNKLYITVWNSFWLAGWPLLYGKLFVTLWQTVTYPMANCLSPTLWQTVSQPFIYNKPIIMTFSQWQTFVSPSGGLGSLIQ